MTVKCREANLERDREEILHFLREHLPVHSDEKRFEWLYLQNPAGPARVWLAAGASGRIIGVEAASPRPVWFDGAPRRAWVLTDLCIAPDSRSLGPALGLQRTCLSGLSASGEALWYDFPSRSMMAVWRRLGVRPAGSQARFVRLTRIDSKVQGYIPNRLLAGAISKVGNLAINYSRASTRRLRDYEIVHYNGQFGEEFTELDSRTSTHYPVRGRRTAEFLNWRYRRNPIENYQVVVAKRGSELAGYAALAVLETEWTIADLHPLEETGVVSGLLGCLHELSRRSNVERLTAPVIDGSLLAFHLTRAGFLRRESSPVIASARNWFLTHGDRDS